MAHITQTMITIIVVTALFYGVWGSDAAGLAMLA